MKALKFLSALLAIFAAFFSFAASGAEAALAKEDIGTVRVGIDGSYPPLLFSQRQRRGGRIRDLHHERNSEAERP